MHTPPSNPPGNDAPARLQPGKHYHFLGIGGVGMSALAAVLHGWGHAVSGSDRQESPQLDALRALGITVEAGHRAEALEGADVLVYSAALPASHPVMEAARARGMPCWHRARLLGAIGQGARTIAVAGTHGKTTCTGALAHLLEHLGDNPTALVGGHLAQWGGGNYRMGDPSLLVCEADESDGSFVHLAPHAVLLTNVEPDHLDHHGTFEHVRAAFAAFLERLGTGALVWCAEDPEAARLAAAHSGPTLAYGWAGGETASQMALDCAVRLLERGPQGSLLEVDIPASGEAPVTLRTPLLGRHNALNLAGVMLLGHHMGHAPGAMARVVAEYQGVRRRQQYVGVAGPWAVYDDYAHHPTEIQATLEAFKAVHSQPLTVIFQPHLYSRTASFTREFAQALRAAEHVLVTGIYGAREEPIPGVSARDIVAAMEGHPSARYVEHWREVPQLLRGGGYPPGLLLTMGAGDITALGPQLCAEWPPVAPTGPGAPHD